MNAIYPRFDLEQLLIYGMEGNLKYAYFFLIWGMLTAAKTRTISKEEFI